MRDLDVRQSRIRLADIYELAVAAHCEREIGKYRAPFAVTVSSPTYAPRGSSPKDCADA